MSIFRKQAENYLGEFVYGAIDGTVTTFAIVAAATGAQFSSGVVIVFGFANLVADGLSMAVSAYLSSKSEVELEGAPKEISPKMTALVTFLAFVFVGVIPVLPYMVDLVLKDSFEHIFFVSSAVSGFVFLAIGLIKGATAKVNLWKSSLEVLLLGAAAAGAAYGAGYLIQGLIN